MKFFFYISIFLLSTVPSFAQDKVNAEIWGKVVKKNSKELSQYKYFLKISGEQGDQYFPLNLKRRKIQKIENYENKSVRFKGQLLRRKKMIEGKVIVYFEMDPDSIFSMSFSDLRPKGEVNYARIKKEKRIGASGGIELDDDVANTAIFAAGAALIGSMFIK